MRKDGKIYWEMIGNISEIKMITLMLLICAGPAFTAAGRDCYLVILNGRVMDLETMFDSIANVGIKDGRIQAITRQKISGKICK